MCHPLAITAGVLPRLPSENQKYKTAAKIESTKKEKDTHRHVKYSTFTDKYKHTYSTQKHTCMHTNKQTNTQTLIGRMGLILLRYAIVFRTCRISPGATKRIFSGSLGSPVVWLFSVCLVEFYIGCA